MVRESAAVKGRRYLCEGRLYVERVGPGLVQARCRGDGEVYALGLEADRWWCSCPAVGACSHLIALRLVVVRAG